MSFYNQKVFSILLMTLITGCATHKPASEISPPPPSSAAKIQAESAQTSSNKQSATTITAWEVNGAMAARNNKKGWTATFNWVQRGNDDYQIRLFGPLGSGTVLIDRQNGVTTYRDGPNVKLARNSDNLLREKTGVALPVSNLYYWSRGLPAPGPFKVIQNGSDNHLKAFQQAGYTIEYPSTMIVNGVTLPKQIKLQGKGILIKVAIKQWKF